MRRLSRNALTTSLIAAGLAIASAAFAGPDERGPGGPGGHGPGSPFMHELRDLNLSDAQDTQIKGFFKAQREQGKSSRDAMHDLHRAYDLAAPGTAQFTTLTTQLADAEAAEVRARVQQMAELRTQIYGVLTPAQRTQLATELANRPEPPPHDNDR